MNLLSILVRDLKTWPAQWGRFCVWAMAEGAPAAWFHTRRPEKIDGGWSDIGTVEHWLGEKPSDDCVVTMEDWVEAIREAKALNAAAAWTGEGTPPAGTQCEVAPDCMACVWSKATILAAGPKWFAADIDGKHEVLSVRNYKFRPIRTAEQIAAQEQLHAVRNAATDIAKTLARFENDLPGGAAAQTVIEAMIEAGYRKPVAP
jgi:hypothetical protein